MTERNRIMDVLNSLNDLIVAAVVVAIVVLTVVLFRRRDG